MNLLNNLNPAQKKVVENTEGPILVLAGAGSGKTRTIIYRTAYLIKEKKISPWNILIVTFTNKAAKELKNRLKNSFNIPVRTMWVGTFHSICSKILRFEHKTIGYEKNFSIYDEKDQSTLLKKVYKDLNLDTNKFPISKVKSIISREKNNLILPEDFFEFHQKNYFTENIYKIYKKYQIELNNNNAMDFDDLLVNTALMFYNNDEIRKKYSEKFKYIMIDEYQDTNYAQFKIIKLLAKLHTNICVVGDDDQAIYSWRGADIRNILEFEKDFKNTKIIKLETNYRSTKQILELANSLIKHNNNRHKKRLKTENSQGEIPTIVTLNSEYDEAKFIAEKIKELIKAGIKANDIAIFYRTNAQSRIFENTFPSYGIQYKLIGTINFFSRKEIKDVLAYLKILVNPNDDLNFLRIINFPRRGIGKKTIEYLQKLAERKKLSLFQTLKQNLNEFPQNIKNKFEKFLQMIEKWQNQNNSNIVTIIEKVVSESGISNLYEHSSDIQDISRWENITQLIISAKEFIENFEEERAPTLEDFLNQISLQTSFDTQMDKTNEGVSLMTIHNAKGLEFDCVFICGVEEGLLPHIKSLEEGNIEEERRLFYVALTRAKKLLFITYATYRRYMEAIEPTIPSRFLSEIQKNLYNKIELTYTFSPPPKNHNILLESQKFYRIGQKVNHPKFGKGIIINVDGADKDAKLTISFNNGELKKIIGTYVEVVK